MSRHIRPLIVASLALVLCSPAQASTEADLAEQMGTELTAADAQGAARGAVTPRVMVSRMRSYEGTSNNAITVVSVTNLNAGSCEVQVEYFAALSGSASCTLSLSVSSGRTFQTCSRGGIGVGDFANCLFTCSPELTNTVGRALVSTTSGSSCSNIAVQGAVLQSDAADGFLRGSEGVNIQRVP